MFATLKAYFPARVFTVLSLALTLSACDGVVTGESVATFEAKPNSTGGFEPVKLALEPAMNPISLNFKAEVVVNPAETGRWNTYVATLSLAGNTVTTRAFNVNNSVDPTVSAPNPWVTHTMMIVDVGSAGDYEIAIAPAKRSEITLTNTKVELRKNIVRASDAPGQKPPVR